jgi:hypothetical protein
MFHGVALSIFLSANAERSAEGGDHVSPVFRFVMSVSCWLSPWALKLLIDIAHFGLLRALNHQLSTDVFR